MSTKICDSGKLGRLNLRHPIIQAPMTGTSSPKLAAEVSKAGALGSVGLGAYDLQAAQEHIEQTKALLPDGQAFNVNLFCHEEKSCPPEDEQAWLEHLRPEFQANGIPPLTHLNNLYASAVGNRALQEMVLHQRPKVVSFHFGLPEQDFIDALRNDGCLTMGCATTLAEAQKIEQSGVDVIIAQGAEAGGHRGVFLPEEDELIGTFALVQLLVQRCDLPIVASGGIMDGRGIAAALQLGASAVQMGTAFVACPESLASPPYRAALQAGGRTEITRAVSGRPARGLVGKMHALEKAFSGNLPPYPFPYHATKAFGKVGAVGYAPFWAGQGVELVRSRSMPAAQLIETLANELKTA